MTSSDRDELHSRLMMKLASTRPTLADSIDGVLTALYDNPDEWRWTCEHGMFVHHKPGEPCARCGQEPERWIRVP